MVARNEPETKKPQDPQDPWEGAEVVFAYTRAQAIADGVLVDLTAAGSSTGALCRQAGFRYPVAMTNGAFCEALGGESELPQGQSLGGRLWDVLMLLKAAIKAQKGPSDRTDFTVRVFDGVKFRDVAMYGHCGPGDDGEPVITIMLDGED